jgi:hypothetical protein
MTHEIWKEAVKAKRGFSFLRFLVGHRVEFMLMGGAAMAYHGLRNAPDDFDDLDILVSPSRSNAARFAEAMNAAASAAGKIVTQKFDPNLMAKQNAKFVPDRNELDCEFVAFLRPTDFASAFARAEHVSLALSRVPVMGIKDLLARKREAIADHQRDIREIEQNQRHLQEIARSGGAMDFSMTNANTVSPMASRLLGALVQFGLEAVYFGPRFKVEGKIVQIKWIHPLEVLLPCEVKDLDAIKGIIQRTWGMTAAVGGIEPGLQFKPEDNDDSLRCTISDSPQAFGEALQNSSPGQVLGRTVPIADVGFLSGVFKGMLRDARERLDRHEAEAEKISASI